MRYAKHFFLTAAMLLCSIVVSAEDFVKKGIYYRINTNDLAKLSVAVTYLGDDWDFVHNEYKGALVIPSVMEWTNDKYQTFRFRVNEIDPYAFAGCYALTSITIPNSVEVIGENAFYGCTGLTSITIPPSVKVIQSGAFKGCTNLKSISIPVGVTSIGEGAFYNCNSLTAITIPESVMSIDNYAFYGCSRLTSVKCPTRLKSCFPNADFFVIFIIFF